MSNAKFNITYKVQTVKGIFLSKNWVELYIWVSLKTGINLPTQTGELFPCRNLNKCKRQSESDRGADCVEE